MRNLLRSKIGVSLLSAVAILAVAANFVKLPAARPLRALAKETTRAVPPKLEATMVLPAPLASAARWRAWKDLLPATQQARDPFTFVAPRSLAGPGAALGPGPVPHFVLQAVSIEGDHALAVLNRQVVAVGETVGDFRVERIEPTSVQLSSGTMRLVVPIDRSKPLEKVASGKAPAADPTFKLPTGSAR